MSRYTTRLARLERTVLAKTPRQSIVLWPGDPIPADLGPRDVVLMVYSVGTPPAPDSLPGDAGAVIFLPDNGRGDGPPRGRWP